MEPGMVLFHGRNGQGKSNLLEAIYLLAIAKSHRASSDREMVRWRRQDEDLHTQVSAVVQRKTDRLRVQIDLAPLADPDAVRTADPSEDGRSGRTSGVRKTIRVNGVPRRAADTVGEVNAVLFTVDDIDLVSGPPPVRRRYLDILISQIDQRYLRSLQRYQRVLSQRNHLLKTIREGRASPGEMEFWDDELVAEGAYLMVQRARTLGELSDSADPIHRELTGDGERLEMIYRPRVPMRPGASDGETASDLRRALDDQRPREIDQGFTVTGPHRDDVQMLLDGVDAGDYASRGQSRTVVLAMKLAEARYLSGARGHEPILLLDDVLSELDGVRRARVLEWAGRYQQCMITTADPASIEDPFLKGMDRLAVVQGRIERSVGEGSWT